MFDFNKLGDMTKLAGQARQIQEKQERTTQRQTELLEKISSQIDMVINLLKNK